MDWNGLMRWKGFGPHGSSPDGTSGQEWPPSRGSSCVPRGTDGAGLGINADGNA
eukprot:CAMPEP_0170079228 /NCGR_PEP_ID=MMETSP0019_2-20121128/15665_1 /TAXON_ID=98059 /ORGANISM="Dinobryon sp., Strain UTEXLB2267" /LENGTH=53 /DNA_ID=CAMNT_0010292587 /DNA_START=469 /DNA_END=630 /DNA_ORIENTATION=+